MRAEVKVMVCSRLLGTSRALGYLEECPQMGKNSNRFCFRQFCVEIIDMYGGKYLTQRPNGGVLDGIEQVYAGDGFRGCVGAADRMKLKWKNCPAGMNGRQYQRKRDGKQAMIQVEAWGYHILYACNFFLQVDVIRISIKQLWICLSL